MNGKKLTEIEQLEIKTKDRRHKMKHEISNKKDAIANENFNDLEEYVYSTIRNDKVALKSLLMKNVKTDSEGKVLLSNDDEWRNECEWDEIQKE